MSNEVSIPSGTFVRTLKNGSTVERTALGVLTSGSKDEKFAVAHHTAVSMIASGNVTMVFRELVRCFPPSTLTKHGVGTVGDEYIVVERDTKTITVIGGSWNLWACESYCEALAKKLAASKSPPKGEKAIYAELAGLVLSYCSDKRKAKQAALGAIEAAKSTVTEAAPF